MGTIKHVIVLSDVFIASSVVKYVVIKILGFPLFSLFL